ncbi:hypothetical protein ScPMuIL_016433 [Solemya velum]
MSGLMSRMETVSSENTCTSLSSTTLGGSQLSREATVYKGPGYYIPTEKRWVDSGEYSALTPETKLRAVRVESREKWRELQRNDLLTSASIERERHTRVPFQFLIPGKRTPWDRPWNGAGYYAPSTEKWFRDLDTPALPKEAIFFHNEEDWLKFKYMSERPCLPPLESRM